jgi:very-short-patch-repair endonuclease/prophage antirepressor-like protein
MTSIHDKLIEKKNTLQVYTHLSINYFVAYEIASLIGYCNPMACVKKHVSEYNQFPFRDYLGYKEPIISLKTILLNIDGVTEILSKTHKTILPDVRNLFKKYNIELPLEIKKQASVKVEINKKDLIELKIDPKNVPTDLTMYSYISNHLCFEYFIGYEISTVLGYSNATACVKRNVSKCNKFPFSEYLGIKEPFINPKTILISRDGAIEILINTRKKVSPDVLNLFKKYNIILKKDLIELKKIDHENVQTDLTMYSYISNHLCFEYFVGYEISALLGYSNPMACVKQNVSKCNQLPFSEYPGVKEPYLDPRTSLISRDGAIEILIKTRKRVSADVLHLFKKFNIDTTNKKCLTKEQQTLSSITNVFKTEDFNDQFKVGNYYLDLYFPLYRIVVECDENGHSDRKPGDERKRMDYVNNEIKIDYENCIRFNPDAEDFDISKVIGRIHTLMKMKGVWIVKYTNPNRYIKNINLSPEKECNTCSIVKSLQDFNKASENRDGFENVCKMCRKKRQAVILAEKK